MIQHDQQSRWKAWMRMLAVDIRPTSMSTLRSSASLSIGATKPGVLPARHTGVDVVRRFATGPYFANTWD